MRTPPERRQARTRAISLVCLLLALAGGGVNTHGQTQCPPRCCVVICPRPVCCPPCPLQPQPRASPRRPYEEPINPPRQTAPATLRVQDLYPPKPK